MILQEILIFKNTTLREMQMHRIVGFSKTLFFPFFLFGVVSIVASQRISQQKMQHIAYIAIYLDQIMETRG